MLRTDASRSTRTTSRPSPRCCAATGSPPARRSPRSRPSLADVDRRRRRASPSPAAPPRCTSAYAAAGVGRGDEVVTTPMTFVATASSALAARRDDRLRRRRGGHRQPRPGGGRGGGDRPDQGRSPASTTPATRPRSTSCETVADAPAPSLARGRRPLDRLDATRVARSGSLADLTTFSFFPTKNMTTAEGGAVATLDAELRRAGRAGSASSVWCATATELRHPDEGPWHQEVHELGLNYRLPDVLCALGLQPAHPPRGVQGSPGRDLRALPRGARRRRRAAPAHPARARRPDLAPLPAAGPGRPSPRGLRRLRADGVGVQVNYIPVYWHPVFEDLGYQRGHVPERRAVLRRGDLAADVRRPDRRADRPRHRRRPRRRRGAERMHHANHFYGHAHIMARYVGLEHPPRIWGYLQHGWNMHDGFAVGTVFTPQYPKFVWSEARARRGWAAGLRNYMVVAAPWLYLLELERQKEWLATAEPRAGTIVYPFHGWEGQQVLGEPHGLRRGDEGDRGTAHHGLPPLERVRQPQGASRVRGRRRARRHPRPARLPLAGHRRRLPLPPAARDAPAQARRQQPDEQRHPLRRLGRRRGRRLRRSDGPGVRSRRARWRRTSRDGIWPEMHQFSVPMDFAAEVANRELGADEMLLPARSSTRSVGPGDRPAGSAAARAAARRGVVGLRPTSSSSAPLGEPPRPGRR